MSITIQFDDTDSIRLTDTTVDPRPPDRLEFAVQGCLTATETVLGELDGVTLNPVRVTVSGDEEPLGIDLTGPASLRLESVDVGVATPDGDAITDGLDALRSSADGGTASSDARPDVLAFTVEGAIRDVSPATLEAIADDAPRIESLTFAVDESVRSDGGSGRDVVFDCTLFGYGVVVRRDGSIVVSSDGYLASIDLA